jgi:hypothetical protein
METPEFQTHAFIVRVWLEETAEEAGRAMWRGHVTHVPSGARRYVKDLDEVVAFIVPYLQELGVRVALFWRVRAWLKQCIKRWKKRTTRPRRPI